MLKKKFILTLLLIFASCSSEKFMVIECQKFSSFELLPRIKELLINEKMDIVGYDSSEGYLKAHLSQQIYSLKSGSTDNFWEIKVDDYEIKARAWTVMNVPSDDFYAEIAPLDVKSINRIKRQYLIDVNSLDASWYKNVKSSIEYLCGNKLEYK